MTNEMIKIGMGEKPERVGDLGFFPVQAMTLKVPENPEEWMTSAEVFKKVQRDRTNICGIPANMGIYRIVDGEPVFNLIGREGNLFLNPEFREQAYGRIRWDGECHFSKAHDFRTREYSAKETYLVPSFLNEGLILSKREKDFVMKAINSGHSTEFSYERLNVPYHKPKLGPRPQGYKSVEDITITALEKNVPEQRKLFLAAFGTQTPRKGNCVLLLGPDFVLDRLADRPDDIIAMGCYVNTHDDFSKFIERRKKTPGFLAANNSFVYSTWVPG